ncbi:exodeoxyribonuclease VII small subunit [Haloarcula salinisoli]|uniref:Exodeoxyribonuclease VII small subunit n=2 Tax=Haloarcula salinisoli TaxID=2487746 RepID=A0A8J7YHL5_9EURY|nr:exodeoxyribonuclease VII small subunit [Halomicroarcula salinisoli]MBX0305692.1 exodeoxyribonuclease VII small subunit [Halomicroarcula salinisoli]
MTETDIADKTDRIESIIEQLESGDVSLERATELKVEGDELLEELEAELDLGDGEVREQITDSISEIRFLTGNRDPQWAVAASLSRRLFDGASGLLGTVFTNSCLSHPVPR